MENRMTEEPSTMEEAEERLLEARLAVLSIEKQLTSHGDDEANETWRKAAVAALNNKKSEITFLRYWTRRRRLEIDLHKADIYTDEAKNLLVLARKKLLDLREEGGDNFVVGLIERYLKHSA